MPFSEDTKYTPEKITPNYSYYFQNEFPVSTIMISGTPFSKYTKYISRKDYFRFKNIFTEYSSVSKNTSKTTIKKYFLFMEKSFWKHFYL